MIGRVLMLAVLVLIGSELQSLTVVGLLFASLGLIPLYEAKLISSTREKARA